MLSNDNTVQNLAFFVVWRWCSSGVVSVFELKVKYNFKLNAKPVGDDILFVFIVLHFKRLVFLCKINYGRC